MTTRLPHRRGFTLIELLVVILLISLLLGLVVGAAMRVRAVSEASTTEATLRKLASILDVQWKAALEMARDEWAALDSVRKNALKGLANNDERRAKVIFSKLVLKREFPCSYLQALNPDPHLPLTEHRYVQPLQQYKIQLQGLNPAPSVTPGPEESIVLLFYALKRPRKGAATINLEETIDANFLRDVTLSNGKSAKVIIDVWGTPMRFVNFPYYCDELNESPFPKSDPHDPENLIGPIDSAWRTSGKQLCFTVGNPSVNPQIPDFRIHPLDLRDPRYLLPTIASAGNDQDWGDDTTEAWPGAGAGTASKLFMKLNSPAADDNLYSFRVRQSGGGSR